MFFSLFWKIKNTIIKKLLLMNFVPKYSLIQVHWLNCNITPQSHHHLILVDNINTPQSSEETGTKIVIFRRLYIYLFFVILSFNCNFFAFL